MFDYCIIAVYIGFDFFLLRHSYVMYFISLNFLVLICVRS